MERPASFGYWLKQERKKRRLTQAYLGEQVSYSADQIRKVEADERRFGAAQARLLAEVLDIPLSEHDAFIAWAHGGPAPQVIPRADAPAAPVLHSLPRDIAQSVALPSRDETCGSGWPADPHLSRNDDPRRHRTNRWHRWHWGVSGLCLVALVGLLGGIGYQRTQHATSHRVVIGGVWLSPAPGFTIHDDTLHLAARAYAASPSDPPVRVVDFTIAWPGAEWQIACAVRSPLSGTTDQYACDWDMAAHHVPIGPIMVSFDVYDTRGTHNDAPNGIHEGVVQR